MDIPQVMHEVFGPQAAGIGWLFGTMELAEQVIAEVGEAPGLFKVLQPSEVLRGKADPVVLAHMREMAGRFHAGGDCRVATRAEVLCGLLGAATRSPLIPRACALVNKLGIEVLGQDFGICVHEQYAGELDEVFAEAARVLWQKGRHG